VWMVILCLFVLNSGAPQDPEDVDTQIEEPPADDEEGIEKVANVEDDENVEDMENVEGGEIVEDGEKVEDGGNVDESEEGFDLNYVVKRPSHDEDDEDICVEEVKGQDGEVICLKTKDLTPYTKYKSYSSWQRRPLFVIIIGGLRWDYLSPGELDPDGSKVANLKAFNWIKKHGTTMSQVVPVFPPYDLPVWTSMATGLYPSKTGVLGDYMYNLKSRELYSKDDTNSSLENWWVSGDPIWKVAAKNGRNVSLINWHDCLLAGKNLDKKDCRPYVHKCPPVGDGKDRCLSNRKPTQLFNRAFSKIHKDRYDLSVVYTDVLKKAAKKYGPNSKEVLDELIKLDNALQGRLADIKNKKERADLKLNILLVSDYGLNGVSKTTKVVLNEYLNMDHVQYIIQRGGSTVLVPFALKAGDIMGGVGNKKGVSKMVGINAYVRDVNLEVPKLDYPEIPDDLHYDGLTWTQDILLVAKAGFEIVIECKSDSDPDISEMSCMNKTSCPNKKIPPTLSCSNEKILPPLNGEEQGQSGYEPRPDPPYIVPGRDKHKTKELRAREKLEVALFSQFAHMMKTVGFAWGPDFKSGYTSEPIEAVDLYQLMAFLLKIPPNNHDGEWSRIRQMLMISGSPSNSCSILLIFIPIVIMNL